MNGPAKTGPNRFLSPQCCVATPRHDLIFRYLVIAKSSDGYL
jgi:hypothetical protein